MLTVSLASPFPALESMAAAAAPAVAVNGIRIGTTSPAYLENKAAKETRALISGLCRYFYTLGSIAIKVHDDSIPKPRQLIVMSPSGIIQSYLIPPRIFISECALFALDGICVCVSLDVSTCMFNLNVDYFCHFGIGIFLVLLFTVPVRLPRLCVE